MFGFLPNLLLLVDIVAMTFLLLVQLTSKHTTILIFFNFVSGTAGRNPTGNTSVIGGPRMFHLKPARKASCLRARCQKQVFLRGPASLGARVTGLREKCGFGSSVCLWLFLASGSKRRGLEAIECRRSVMLFRASTSTSDRSCSCSCSCCCCYCYCCCCCCCHCC